MEPSVATVNRGILIPWCIGECVTRSVDLHNDVWGKQISRALPVFWIMMNSIEPSLASWAHFFGACQVLWLQTANINQSQRWRLHRSLQRPPDLQEYTLIDDDRIFSCLGPPYVILVCICSAGMPSCAGLRCLSHFRNANSVGAIVAKWYLDLCVTGCRSNIDHLDNCMRVFTQLACLIGHDCV